MKNTKNEMVMNEKELDMVNGGMCNPFSDENVDKKEDKTVYLYNNEKRTKFDRPQPWNRKCGLNLFQ